MTTSCGDVESPSLAAAPGAAGPLVRASGCWQVGPRGPAWTQPRGRAGPHLHPVAQAWVPRWVPGACMDPAPGAQWAPSASRHSGLGASVGPRGPEWTQPGVKMSPVYIPSLRPGCLGGSLGGLHTPSPGARWAPSTSRRSGLGARLPRSSGHHSWPRGRRAVATG